MAASVNSENTVKKIYQTVIDEVLGNIREAFLDEGYDEQLLSELKQMWEAKLNQSRALAQSSADDSAAGGPSSEHHSSSHHHHHHHHHQAGSSLRLPISSNSATAPTAKEVAHQMIARNASNMSNQQPVSSGSSRAQAVDTKPSIVQIMDPHTRAAFQALPQSILYSQTVQHQQQQEKLKKQQQMATGTQLDGHTGADAGSSSEDEDDDLGAVGSAHGDDDDDDDKTNNDDPSEYEGKEDPDPLNSGDDLTEPSTPDSNSDLFDTENVIVCQYDKITRIKNKWKFHLKDGIMNINGKDYLFSKATGDAEW